MARLAPLLLGLGSLGALLLARRARAASAASIPAPAPVSPVMPPPVVPVAPPPSAPDLAPAPAVPAPVSAVVPSGMRRMTNAELTPELIAQAQSVLSQGFAPGSVTYFDGSDGQQYAALTERTSAGRIVVSLAVSQ